MAIGDIKTYDFVYNGLTLQVNAIDLGSGTTTFSITCLSGYADINALYWGDAIADGSSFDLGTKKDNSLNMNGTGVDWDGGVKLSSTGLGTAGTDKPTYLTAGETYDKIGVAVDWDSLSTLGVRATTTSTAEGSIKGVDATGVVTTAPQISIDDQTVHEADGNAVFTVSLDHAYLYDITIAYSTADVSAHAPSDYTAASSTVTILAGQTSATISVGITDDNVPEPTETFHVNLTGATADIPGPDISLASDITDGQGLGTILDDDTAQGPVAHDDSWVITNATQFTIGQNWMTWNDDIPAGHSYVVTAIGGAELPGSFQLQLDGSILVHASTQGGGDDQFDFTYTLTDTTTNLSSTATVYVQIVQPDGVGTNDNFDLTAYSYDYSYIDMGNGGDAGILSDAQLNQIVGGLGQDTMTGVNGTQDRFVYTTEAESTATYFTNGANSGEVNSDSRDTIQGFASGEDKIDLRGLDGLSSVGQLPGDTIAAHSFGWKTDGAFTDIYVNTSDDAQTITDGADYSASMEIHLAGGPSITAGDFLFTPAV
jgi:Calx-beta domain